MKNRKFRWLRPTEDPRHKWPRLITGYIYSEDQFKDPKGGKVRSDVVEHWVNQGAAEWVSDEKPKKEKGE